MTEIFHFKSSNLHEKSHNVHSLTDFSAIYYRIYVIFSDLESIIEDHSESVSYMQRNQNRFKEFPKLLIQFPHSVLSVSGSFFHKNVGNLQCYNFSPFHFYVTIKMKEMAYPILFHLFNFFTFSMSMKRWSEKGFLAD